MPCTLEMIYNRWPCTPVYTGFETAVMAASCGRTMQGAACPVGRLAQLADERPPLSAGEADGPASRVLAVADSDHRLDGSDFDTGVVAVAAVAALAPLGMRKIDHGEVHGLDTPERGLKLFAEVLYELRRLLLWQGRRCDLIESICAPIYLLDFFNVVTACNRLEVGRGRGGLGLELEDDHAAL